MVEQPQKRFQRKVDPKRNETMHSSRMAVLKRRERKGEMGMEDEENLLDLWSVTFPL